MKRSSMFVCEVILLAYSIDTSENLEYSLYDES